MDMKQLEDTLRSSNFIYERAFKAGHDSGYALGYKEALAAAQDLINRAMADWPKRQAG
jgi:flagellar biosynthesis/type III secretory pathway protein FliH